MKPKLLLFDVNETLLDLSKLEETINRLLNDKQAFQNWFRMLLHYSLVETCTKQYSDFNEIGKATLQMTAQYYKKNLKASEIEEHLSVIKELPAYPEVPEALEQLAARGYKLAGLTNGSLTTVEAQLKYAEIQEFFDGIFSVDAVQRYKPHPETYNHVLTKMKIAEASEAMLVAAHAWDITGAQRAGLRTCFVSRPGKFLYPLAQEPDFSIATLKVLVDQLP